MEYQLKWPNSPEYEYTLDRIRSEFERGMLSDDVEVRRIGFPTWLPLSVFLESTNDIVPQAQPTTQANAASAIVKVADVKNVTSNAVASRYRDAYFVALAVEFLGGMVTLLAFCGGAMAVIAAFVIIWMVSEHEPEHKAIIIAGIIVVAVSAILIWILVWMLGILFRAKGQSLKATLDIAVHSSPFLTDSQRASIMSIDVRPD